MGKLKKKPAKLVETVRVPEPPKAEKLPGRALGAAGKELDTLREIRDLLQGIYDELRKPRIGLNWVEAPPQQPPGNYPAPCPPPWRQYPWPTDPWGNPVPYAGGGDHGRYPRVNDPDVTMTTTPQSVCRRG